MYVLRATGPASGEAERPAREAEPDFDIVVAAGGDGMPHAVVNGLAALLRQAWAGGDRDRTASSSSG